MHIVSGSDQSVGLFAFDFFVDGVTCARCVQKLNDLKLPWIEKVSFDLTNSHLKIYTKDPNPPIGEAQESIRRLGFTSRSLLDEDSAGDHKKKEAKKRLAEIAVAGFCAGNVMLMTLSIYGGSEANWSILFGWLSFALFLPIVFFSARPFYISAWRSLVQRQAGVDIPIVIALWLGFLLSTWNLINGRTEFYYDSTASFLFLILASRFLLAQFQNHFLSQNDLRVRLSRGFARKKDGHSILQLRADQVMPNDILLIHAGEMLAHDGRLLSPSANFDLGFFSGESQPKTVLTGEQVWAGSRLLSDQCEFQVTSDLKMSRLGQIMNSCHHAWQEKSVESLRVEKWAHWLVGSVMMVALGLFLYWFKIDFREAINRPLALLIVACPCAMAFAIPVSYLVGLRKAFDRGLLVRDASTLDRALEIQNVLLDKTGTLTQNQLRLQSWYPRVPTEAEKLLMWHLEKGSEHPMAHAVRRALGPVAFESINISQLSSHFEGVSGEWNGDLYELKRSPSQFLPPAMRGMPSATLFKNGLPVLSATFSESLKEGASELVQWLQSQNYSVNILSGDNQDSVSALAHDLGLAKAQALGGLSPEEKAKLATQGSCLFLGDGVNDALALTRARVGVATQGSIEGLMQTSDAFITNGKPLLVKDLILIARFCRGLVKRNLQLSVAYNLIAGGLAIAGYINPLLAALLMPVNSVITISSSIWSWKRWEIQ